MAKGLKTNGVQEIEAVIRRVRRQRSFKRISRADEENLEDLLQQAISYIVRMDEEDDEGKKEF